MARRADTATKSRIVEAAWQLFYEKGFDHTSVEEIVARSGTSKGSFYHYFESKDALLGSLAYLFDEKYAELEKQIDPAAGSMELLLWLNRELFSMIETSIDLDLLGGLYSTQLVTKGQRELMDRNREYYRLLRRIVAAGQEKGELTAELTAGEIVRLYAMCERAMLYDWCLSQGEYSLRDQAALVMPRLLQGIKGEKSL
ncbi:MAG: TetR/AcrR family transcriptional regulator [Clostridia bacterium]|nr:TetR/AcrR family transcriptional regulator [Clostridia bacterium]